MDKIQNRLGILAIAYDEIDNSCNNEMVSTQIQHIKNSIKELSETLNILSKISNK